MIPLARELWASARPYVGGGRGGLLFAPHMVHSGIGEWWTDVWPDPAASLPFVGGNLAAAGDVGRIEPAFVAEIVRERLEHWDRIFIDVPDVLRAALGLLQPWPLRSARALGPPRRAASDPRAEIRRLGEGEIPAFSSLDASLHWIGDSWGGLEGLARGGRAWAAWCKGQLAAISAPGTRLRAELFVAKPRCRGTTASFSRLDLGPNLRARLGPGFFSDLLARVLRTFPATLCAIMLGTLVVVNPAAAGGRAKRRFEKLEAKVREHLGELDVEWTRGPRDAERIVREAVRAGVERVIVAGGDGTMREVVAGALSAGVRVPVELGLLPLGTGGDLRRTLGVPRNFEGALAALNEVGSRPLDAGRATFVARDGGRAETCFANVASMGVSGLITELVNAAPKALGGRISFLIGTVRGLLRYSAVPVRLRLDGELLFEGPLLMAAVANGSWFGGGMHVAPGARADDGLFDVIVIPDFGRARLLVDLPRIYAGTHLGVEGVLSARGRLLEAEPLAADDAVWLEIDGEPLGRLPARFEVLPGALRMLGAQLAPGTRS